MKADKKNKALLKMVESDGWKVAREKIMNRIDDLQSIMNLESVKPEELVTEVKVRGLVVQELVDILKEIEGEAEQVKLKDEKYSPDESFSDPNIIKRLEVQDE